MYKLQFESPIFAKLENTSAHIPFELIIPFHYIPNLQGPFHWSSEMKSKPTIVIIIYYTFALYISSYFQNWHIYK